MGRLRHWVAAGIGIGTVWSLLNSSRSTSRVIASCTKSTSDLLNAFRPPPSVEQELDRLWATHIIYCGSTDRHGPHHNEREMWYCLGTFDAR